MIPVTGSQHEVGAGDYSAVVTELGAGLRELRYRGQPVIAGYQPDELPPGAAGQLLAPWPNRIDGGRYTLDGTSYQVDLSEPARGIPAGTALDVAGTDADFRTTRPIGDTRLDHTLTGLARDGQGRAWARLAAEGTQIALWAGQGYEWLQVFTGDTLDAARRRRAVAVEPMTCPPNAFATGTDLLMLDPGSSVTHSWGIRVTGQPASEG